MAIKQQGNNIFSGQESELPLTGITSTLFMTENTKKVYGYFSDKSPKLLNVSITGGTVSGSTLIINNNDGTNINVSGLSTSYWVSGSSGNYSIKTINDSTIDATGDYSYASGQNTIASGNNSFVYGKNSSAISNNTIVLGESLTGSVANTTVVETLLGKKVGVNTTNPLTELHSVGDFRLDNLSSNSSLSIDYYASKSGFDGIIYTNWFVPSYDGRMYQYYTQHVDTDYTHIFYHPSSGYSNSQSSSTYIMRFETGYDDALNQSLTFQLNGYDKLSLLENGTVVLGQPNAVNPQYPSILRASDAYTFLSDSPGKDLTIQGGSGRGTGSGGTINFNTTPSGTTGTVLNTPVTRMSIDTNGKVNILQLLNISNISEFADNAAAISGGLEVGDVYRTSTGVLMIRY